MKLFVLIASALAQDAAQAATNETATQPPPTNPPDTGQHLIKLTSSDLGEQTSPLG